jgi:hypothetical protein
MQTFAASPSRSHARRDGTVSTQSMYCTMACWSSGCHSTFSACFASSHSELELSSPKARTPSTRRGPACAAP